MIDGIRYSSLENYREILEKRENARREQIEREKREAEVRRKAEERVRQERIQWEQAEKERKQAEAQRLQIRADLHTRIAQLERERDAVKGILGFVKKKLIQKTIDDLKEKLKTI